jgi:hypothetical protein
MCLCMYMCMYMCMFMCVGGKSLEEKDMPLEYLLAHFGTKVPHSSAHHDIVMAKPAEACKALENDVKGNSYGYSLDCTNGES